jgi:hypothetical protein
MRGRALSRHRLEVIVDHPDAMPRDPVTRTRLSFVT